LRGAARRVRLHAVELERSIDALDLLCRTRRVFVLTGAGLSTNSGIPDYRGEGARLRKRPPMTIKEFRSGDDAQRRYWARSYMGWPSFAAARPNAGHQALARLGAAGAVHALVTQNVDRLHHRAGSRDAVELHGALEDVLCLSCGAREHRDALQLRLAALNPDFTAPVGVSHADGDVELEPNDTVRWTLARCLACEGPLKPDVVFFGENVPPATTRAAFSAFDAADALLVVGSSLTVFSGYRFALRAHERGWPIAIVNVGPTRADPLAALRVEHEQGVVLSALAARWS
jgi:NAD-dependent SIR2 family protein deacetylase